MNLHEYQAKEVLARFGVPVPRGQAAASADEARAAAQALGGAVTVVKAQVHAGGRGKAGGVKLAHTPEEVRTVADHLHAGDVQPGAVVGGGARQHRIAAFAVEHRAGGLGKCLIQSAVFGADADAVAEEARLPRRLGGGDYEAGANETDIRTGRRRTSTVGAGGSPRVWLMPDRHAGRCE